MALKIRLRQMGRTNQLVYRLVVTDSRAPRDGKYLEKLGYYDPAIEGKNVSVESDRIRFWLDQGAELTEKAESLILRAAPEVIKNYRQKRIKRQLQLNAKRKARKSKQPKAQKKN